MKEGGVSKRSLLLVIMVASVLAACDHEVSIVLFFPNEISRQATERLVVEVYPAAGRPNACDDYLPLAATGGSPLSDYVARGDYEFTGSGADLILTKVPAIAQVVYVVGYPTREEPPTPILVGCAGDFDPSRGSAERKEVPVVLETVFPKTTSLRAVSGNRQVGRPGELLRPMTVALRGEVLKLDYGIPGVPIDFEAKRGFEIVGDGEADASSARVLTDEEGRASVLVRAPTALDLHLDPDPDGGYEVIAVSLRIPTGAATSGLPEGEVLETEFLASSTPPVRLGVVAELSGRARSVPVDLLVTPLWRTPSGPSQPVLEPSVLVLGCGGIESDTGCLAGDRAVRPFGTASLSVFHDLLGDGDRLDLPTGDGGLDLGILPQAILAFPGETSAAGTDIVLLNSRHSPEPDPHPCDTKPTTSGCGDAGPCVGSWSEACDVTQRAQLRSIHLDPTGVATVTSSAVTVGRNAVAMTAYDPTGSGPREFVIAVVVAGRAENVRQCSVPIQCRTRPVPSCGSKIGDVCDCWPGESCECPGCAAGESLGVCTPPDRIVDFAKLNTSRTLERWILCANPTIECDPLEPSKSECSCSPDPPGGECPGDSRDGRDRCGCRIPVRSWIGGRISAGGGTSRPNSVSVGDGAGLRAAVVASDGVGGLELMKGDSTSGGYPAFEWEDRPAVNLAVAKALFSSVDTALDPKSDVVWYARQPCSTGFADSATCPIEGVGTSGRGCFGALLTGGSAPDVLSARAKGACVRYSVRFAPDGMCLADFNADGAIDVALASRDDPALLVYAGNGLGGFRDPPEVFELGGVGGPMDCHDLDPGARSDGEEAIVVDRGSGRLRVLKRRE